MMYIDPNYSRVINEYFDYTDDKTRKWALTAVTEANQAEILDKLSSKLYQMIIQKIDKIDYGRIPDSKGDVTKMPNYNEMVECLDTIYDILLEYKQDVKPTKIIIDALTNLRDRTGLFTRAFQLNLEFPMMIYNTIALSCMAATSFLISTCIDYIKDADEIDFTVAIDRTSVYRSKDYLLFRDLEKFNNICTKGDLDKTMEYMIKSHTTKLMGIDSLAIGSVVILAILALTIIPLIRELIFLFYHIRCSISDFLDVQADMIQLNMYNLEQSDMPNAKKKEVLRKQEKIVKTFRSLSAKIAVEMKAADNKTGKEIKEVDSKKYKKEDIETEKRNNDNDNSTDDSLF